MAHKGQQEFCERAKQKYPNYFINKKVLDIGSLDINGSNKYLFENCSYIGLDIGKGKNVDVVSIGHLYDAPNEYFDTIISTNTFEHDMFYEQTFANVFRMLKPGGLFLMTCGGPGWPEHGTRRTGTDSAAPLLIEISEEWANYYKNLSEEDVKKIPQFVENFPDGYFEYGECKEEDFYGIDLHFYGIKGGIKYLTDHITPLYPKEEFDGDIFVVDCWIDTVSKENDLVNLIKRLKIYNIPIVLTGHYPIKPEIQKMVDYFLYDAKNPLLMNDEFYKYGINSVRWSDMGDILIENHREFHHDYAIWETMRNAFNFCKFLGKKYIHFMEYDNYPEIGQYRQAFIERTRDYDAVIFEYDKGSTSNINPYCATFIFSIKTDIAVKLIDTIKTKDDFFANKSNKWQLEKNFFNSLKSITGSIHISKYIPNEKEFNTQALWNRDGINRNGFDLQFYLVVDDINDLYLHIISDDVYLIEVTYDEYKKFNSLSKGEFAMFNLGQYKYGRDVKVYHQGIEIFHEELCKSDVVEFRKYNRILKKTKKPIEVTPKVDINFIDGPFIEITNDVDCLFHVQFINRRNNVIEFELDMKNNCWAKCSRKYYIDWLIKVRGVDNEYVMDYTMDMSNKNVLISFESKSLGDTLAWFPQVERFRIEKNCKVICSTFHNNLFRKQYPNIQFVNPGTSVNNIHALYRLGVFHKEDNDIDYDMHFIDPKSEPLIKVASDILGLSFIEIKPKLPVSLTTKKKMVTIAVHATAQCKYWNNPLGWQTVVDFLIQNGYEVRLLSKEEDGYMGNPNPKGVTKMRTNNEPIENIIKTIRESELFIGISSGLSWVAWGAETETILISGFTDVFIEPISNVRRIINKDVCHGCWSKFDFNPGDWNWCPVHKGTDRQFECSKTIEPKQVIDEIKLVLNL